MKQFTVEECRVTSVVPSIRIYIDGKYKFTLWDHELSMHQAEDLLSGDQEKMWMALEAAIANRKFELSCLEELVTELKA